MTTPVAGAPNPTAVEVSRHPRYSIIAWNTGHGFTRWHIERAELGHTLCGRAIPDTKLSHHVGRSIMSDDICQACVEVAMRA